MAAGYWRTCSTWGHDVFHKAGVPLRYYKRTNRYAASNAAHEAIMDLMSAANGSGHIRKLIYRNAEKSEPCINDFTDYRITLSEAGLSILGYLCKCRRKFLPRELAWIKRYKALTVEMALAHEV